MEYIMQSDFKMNSDLIDICSDLLPDNVLG